MVLIDTMDKFDRYFKLSEMEERFNSSSGGIRSLASAWLLASLGAIGWLFSSYDPLTWPLPLGFLVIVVTTLGCIGMITLWVMDQLVFHRLLTSVFMVGLKIENDDPDIPPIRSLMMKTQEGIGTYRWEKLFYLMPILLFILITGVLVIGGSVELFSPNTKYFSLSTYSFSVVLGILQLLSTMWMIIKFPSMSMARASYFGDAEFEDLVKNRRFENTISRFRSNPNCEK